MAPNTLRQAPFETELIDPRLGRLPEFDVKSLNFPMRELTATRKYPRSREWKIRQRLNQGSKPHCVGYSIAMEIGMQPYYHTVTDYLADLMYKEAQKIDYWPGEGYAGTSVLAGMETARKLGFYDEYRWALKPDPIRDIVMCLSYIGPIVAGTTWTKDMYNKDASGFIKPTGDPIGGHAYVLSELDWPRRAVYSPNSWGDEGFWMKLDDLEKLVYDNGEMAIPLKRD